MTERTLSVCPLLTDAIENTQRAKDCAIEAGSYREAAELRDIERRLANRRTELLRAGSAVREIQQDSVAGS